MLPRPPEAVAREMAYPRRDIWILLAICFAVRLIGLPINQAEYTDGVIQVRQFVEPVGIWPPLYTALVYPLHFIVGYMWSGRLITTIASALSVIPIYRMARRAFGTRAALYAGVFVIVAPVAMRWGSRMMTDSTFAFFFWWACERFCHASDERDATLARKSLGLGCLMAVLASLTRYQGLMLLGPAAAVAAIMWRRFGKMPIRPLLWLLGLVALPVWVALAERFLHTQQFAERALSDEMPLWKVLLLNGEAFIAYMPYWLTYPVAIFCITGMFWSRMRRGPFFGWLVLYVAVVLLLAQSAFSSLQERYFLPLMGFFWVLAGAGMYAVEDRWCRPAKMVKTRMFPYVMIGTYLFSAAFGLLVLIAQREAFGDIARASRDVGRLAQESNAEIYTNELYRATPDLIAANKVSFFSKRPARFLDEAFYPRNGHGPTRVMAPGSYVVLSSSYGPAAPEELLGQYYRLVPVGGGEESPGIYSASLLPLYPDIMERTGVAQNPLAWVFRFEWQRFATRTYRVEAKR